jgi:hypothetical protein
MQLSSLSSTVKNQQQQSVQPQAQNNSPVAKPLASAKDAFQKTSTQKAPQFGGGACRKLTDLDARDQHGKTAVAKAAMYNYTQDVRELVDAGADVSITDNDGNFPLLEAAENGSVPIASYLLTGKNANVNQQNDNDDTALLRASFSGHAPLVEFLLREGADKSLANKQGHTALSEALLAKKLIANSNEYTPEEKAKYEKRYTKIINLLQPQQQNHANAAGDQKNDEKQSAPARRGVRFTIFNNK